MRVRVVVRVWVGGEGVRARGVELHREERKDEEGSDDSFACIWGDDACNHLHREERKDEEEEEQHDEQVAQRGEGREERADDHVEARPRARELEDAEEPEGAEHLQVGG